MKKKKSETIILDKATHKFKSKARGENFIFESVKISSGHRIRHGGKYDTNLRDNKTTELIEIQALNTNQTANVTLYIPLTNLDEILKAINSVRPPQKQLVFGKMYDELDSYSSKDFINSLTSKVQPEPDSIFRKEKF